MAHRHAPMDRKLRNYEKLPRGRRPGLSGTIVPKEYYPKVFKMYQEGYLNSVIGKRFHVSGQTIGRIVKKYEATL